MVLRVLYQISPLIMHWIRIHFVSDSFSLSYCTAKPLRNECEMNMKPKPLLISQKEVLGWRCRLYRKRASPLVRSSHTQKPPKPWYTLSRPLPDNPQVEYPTRRTWLSETFALEVRIGNSLRHKTSAEPLGLDFARQGLPIIPLSLRCQKEVWGFATTSIV